MTKSEIIRSEFKKNDDIRDAGLTTPEDIIRYDDILYGQDTDWQVLDVYRPRNVSGDLPVIISVHGGGWVYGDKERYQYYCMELALQGFAVVNFTYRLAPEYKFPAPVEDTARVFEWVLDNAATYGFDTKHVFAVGDSAGAQILGTYMSLLINPSFEDALKNDYEFTVSHKVITRRQYNESQANTKDECLVVDAVALNCGVYKLDEDEKLMYDYLENHGTAQELEYMNIPQYIGESYPDVFLMTCYGDFLIEQPRYMMEALDKVRVPYHHKVYGSEDKPLFHVFHCDIRHEVAKVCNKEQCDFFKTFI